MLLSYSMVALWTGLFINAVVHREYNLSMAYFCLIITNLHIALLKKEIKDGDTN